MKQFRFPYGRYELGPGDVIHRPVVPLRVIGPNGDSVELDATLDTGADDTILPLFVIDAVHPEMLSGPQGTIRGITGDPVPVLRGTVGLEVRIKKQRVLWQAEVTFLAAAPARTLCGHRGFLEYFVATFHGEGRFVDLVPRSNLPRWNVERTG